MPSFRMALCCCGGPVRTVCTAARLVHWRYKATKAWSGVTASGGLARLSPDTSELRLPRKVIVRSAGITPNVDMGYSG